MEAKLAKADRRASSEKQRADHYKKERDVAARGRDERHIPEAPEEACDLADDNEDFEEEDQPGTPKFQYLANELHQGDVCG